MLHSVATGNILPASIPLVCVDINPATVTKLADRGSSQARGIVTDVGLFLEQLALELVPELPPAIARDSAGLQLQRSSGDHRRPSADGPGLGAEGSPHSDAGRHACGAVEQPDERSRPSAVSARGPGRAAGRRRRRRRRR